MKFINTQLQGEFKDSKGKVYKVDSSHISTKDVVNFYVAREGEDLLVCSVWTHYLSRAAGVKKAGDYKQETYGDYQIYMDYLGLKERAKVEKDVTKADEKVIGNYQNISGFAKVLEKSGESFFQKLVYADNVIVEEIIQYLEDGVESEYVRLNVVETGKKVKVEKVKGVKYTERASGSQGKDNRIVQTQSLDYIALKKDISWMKERNYVIIDTEEDFEAYLKRIEENDDVVGFDTETTGLSINRFPQSHPRRDKLVGLCFSVEHHEGAYIPLRQKLFNNLDEDYVIEKLRPYICSKGEKAKNLVTHHGSFDWKVMYTYDIDLNITDDTYILQYLIDVRQANAVKKLKVMSEKILGKTMIDLEDFFPSRRGGKKANIRFDMLPYDSVKHYGPVDGDLTRELYFELRPQLPQDMRFIYGVEIDLMKRLGRTEYFGIRVDLEKTMEIKENTLKDIARLEKEVYEVAGEEFKIGSNQQLEKILYDKLKYPVHGYTKTGNRATGKDVLEMLRNDEDKNGEKLYPLADKLLEYSKKTKLLNSFIDKILVDNIDGFLFPKYNQAGTQSGRISGNNPNLQQTSGAIRDLFIPDNDDYYFLIVDYSQVEYRIMAGLADEYEVVEQFKDVEADFHTLMYSRMKGIKYEDVTKKERKIGKILNFGISYGMAPPSLAIKLHGGSNKEQVEDAKQKIDQYFDNVANIRDFLTRTKDAARLRGYVKTLFNRRRHIPEFLKENPARWEIESGKRKAGNTVVQGTAADIMKYANVRVENRFDEEEIDARVLGNVHDELVIQVNKKYNPWWMIDKVRYAMEIDLSKFDFPPLYIGANVGNTWGDGKLDNLEVPVFLAEKRREEVAKGMHTEAMENPREQIAEELRHVALQVVHDEIERTGVKTVEKAKTVPKLIKYAEDFLGHENVEFVIKGLLNGDSVDNVFANMEKKDVLGEDYYEVIEVAEEADESSDGEGDVLPAEDKAIINYEKMIEYYENNKDKLKLKTTYIRHAGKVYNEDYSILAYDRKVFIKINKPTKAMMEELLDYMKKHDVEKGYQVGFQLQDKLKMTDYHLVRLDRLEILGIIEKHMYGVVEERV